MKTNFVVEIKIEFDGTDGNIECSVTKDSCEVKPLNFSLTNVSTDKENRVNKLSQIFYDLGLEIAKKINIYEEMEDLNRELDKPILNINNQKY